MASLRDQVLQAVLELPNGGTLTEIAQALRRDPPPIYHHLQTLVHEGILRRDESQGRPRYLAQPYFAATLVLPETAQVTSWAISDRVSWRFPLTSRILDKRARDTVILFLRQADWEGLFTRPDLLTKEAKKGLGRTRGLKRQVIPEKALGWRFVVYGSVARGLAGPSSDVDLLALPGPAIDGEAYVDPMKDIAAAVNLASPRRLDVKVVVPSRPPSPDFVREVRRDGILVYSTYDGGEYEPLLEEQIK